MVGWGFFVGVCLLVCGITEDGKITRFRTVTGGQTRMGTAVVFPVPSMSELCSEFKHTQKKMKLCLKEMVLIKNTSSCSGW